jgi:uncharacterized protein (TIGR02466 family)
VEENMISNLFGVNVYVGEVKEKSKIDNKLCNIDLKSLTNFSDHWSCECYTNHSQDLVKGSELWAEDFVRSIMPNVKDYIEMLSGEDQPEYEISFGLPWINLYEKNNYQEIHNHLGNGDQISFLSYAYIHKLPNDSGSFIFHNPNYNQVYLGQQHCEHLIPPPTGSWTPEVEEGFIIIFPSWLEHYVTPNRSEDQRITISGNIKRIK